MALIPARGGSKGVPRKNLAALAGKPLIAHTILAARDSGAMDRVFVSTEDSEIAAVSRAYGAEVIARPHALADDDASCADVVHHAYGALRAMEESAPLLALLLPTAPLRSGKHLAECVSMFRNSDAASAVAVTETEHAPFKALLLEDNRLVPLFRPEHLGANRQTLPKTYRQNGAMWLLHWNDFLRTGQFVIHPAAPYLMPPWASVDIDVAEDLTWAEMAMGRNTERPA